MDCVGTDSSAGPVRPAHKFDESRLLQYLLDTVPGALPTSPQLTVKQFSHGQSNPTYMLELSQPRSVSKTVRMVLRKKPPGKILASAHAVEREHRVISSLYTHSVVPVPEPVALCEDPSVIGTPFYVMGFAPGMIYLDPNLPGQSSGMRRHIYGQMASTLAKLHAANPAAIKLGDYGVPTAYCSRQLSRWTKQYHASVASPMPEVLQLVSWLEGHVPAEDASPPHPCICHGDYRLDNLVIDPQGGYMVRAVLDWELSTLGNPWADLAYNCLPYHLPAGLPALRRLSHPLPEGVPSEEEYVSWYCAALGRAPPSPEDWAFYLALSIFRLLAILAGVQARAKQGNASSANAAAVASDQVLRALAQAALNIINRVGTTRMQAPGPAAAGTSSGPASSSGGSAMSVDRLPPRVAELRSRLLRFMEAHVYPAEEVLETQAAGEQRWSIHPLQEQLKAKAKAEGLWNLWLPASLASQLHHLLPLCEDAADREVLLGAGLSNLEYAHLCEIMGRSAWAPECFNCSAPDTGNMEILAKYGSKEQQQAWLLPLLRGQIRSCFAMTEKLVASSDATNIQASIKLSGSQYVLNGIKWWTSGACDPRCKIAIFMGKTDPTAAAHKQQSMILVPMECTGVKVVRPMLVYGYDDAPHGHAEVHFTDVRVPASNMILGEGRGFEIAQGRLGPGRLHHCMRLVGAAERAIELMASRGMQRTVFGGPIAKQGAYQADLARCRIDLNGARLLVLAAADALDQHGNKGARGAIAMAKVAAPNMALRVIDSAVQVHGAAGVSQDTVLSRLWTAARTLRIADGPDEVHLGTIAKLELAAQRKREAAPRAKL